MSNSTTGSAMVSANEANKLVAERRDRFGHESTVARSKAAHGSMIYAILNSRPYRGFESRPVDNEY